MTALLLTGLPGIGKTTGRFGTSMSAHHIHNKRRYYLGQASPYLQVLPLKHGLLQFGLELNFIYFRLDPFSNARARQVDRGTCLRRDG
jgi:hypothetical protein